MYIVPSLPLPTHAHTSGGQSGIRWDTFLAGYCPTTYTTSLSSSSLVSLHFLIVTWIYNSSDLKCLTRGTEKVIFTIANLADLHYILMKKAFLGSAWDCLGFDTECVLKIFCSLLWCKAGLKDGQKVQLGGGGGPRESSVSNETVWDIRKCKC